jgi:hypothetical protein
MVRPLDKFDWFLLTVYFLSGYIEEQEEQEEERTDEKIINEGAITLLGWGFKANNCRRVQNMEEKCALSLRYDFEHSSGMANIDCAMASR